MTRTWIWMGGVSAALAVVWPALAAAADAPISTARHTTMPPPLKAAPARNLDAGALAALRAMSTYLRSLPAFEVTLTTQRSQVDDSGQTLTFDGQSVYKVKGSSAFSAMMTDSEKSRSLVYDGHSFSMLDTSSGLYSQIQAPPTTRLAIEMLDDGYGIRLPLSNLFRWDQGDHGASQLQSAVYVGQSKIEGQDTDHFALSQKGLNWQIWITRGDKPLPLRVVIIGTDDKARPQFEANMAWNTEPTLSAEDFAFTPPANGHRIAMLPRDRKGASQ